MRYGVGSRSSTSAAAPARCVGKLAALVGPEGAVTGVEPNPVLRALAEERSDDTDLTYVDGTAAALPFPEASLDLVWCERVLQHVDDAQAALHEMARVLRPGGRALVLDADHGSNVESDLPRHVEVALQEAFQKRVPNPYAARHLPRQAMAAGFTVDPDIGSAALVFPQAILEEAGRLRQAGAAAVADGTLSVDEVVTAVSAQQAAARKGWAFSAVTVFSFVLTRPEYAQASPRSYAYAAAAVRDPTSILVKMLDRCRATVFSLSTSSAAIWALLPARGDQPQHLDLARSEAVGRRRPARAGDVAFASGSAPKSNARAANSRFARVGPSRRRRAPRAPVRSARGPGRSRTGPRCACPQRRRLAQVRQRAGGIAGGEFDRARGVRGRGDQRGQPNGEAILVELGRRLARASSRSPAATRTSTAVGQQPTTGDGVGRLRHQPSYRGYGRLGRAPRQPQQRRPGLRVVAVVDSPWYAASAAA